MAAPGPPLSAVTTRPAGTATRSTASAPSAVSVSAGTETDSSPRPTAATVRVVPPAAP